MNIENTACKIEMGRNETVSVRVYVDNGEDFLSPLTIKIQTGRQGGDDGLLTVYAPSNTHPDGKEYFMSKDGIKERYMV